MATNASLSIASLINVSTSLAQAATQGQGTQSLLVLSGSPVIDATTRMAPFSSSSQVAQLFGSAALETEAAELWFQQSSNTMFIGRWAQTATAGQLIGAPLTPAQQLVSAWQAITDGGFSIAINGSPATQVTGISFAAVNNLNAVAALIQPQLAGASIVYNAFSGNFVLTSSTSGVASTVSFAAPPTGEGVTDISSLLGLTESSSGCIQANGVAAESALSAATLFDQMFGAQWYGMAIIGAADTDHTAVASFLSSTQNKHFYFTSTQQSGALVAAFTTDIASVLQSANVGKAAVQYSGTSPLSAISLAGKMLSVNYAGSNTVIAGMYQNEPGISPDALNSMQLAALIAKNCNGFVAYNNGSSIIQPGVCCNGQFLDTVIGADALALTIMSTVDNLLLSQHIPQTDSGMHQIKVAIESVLQQFVTNGFIAPGVWNGPLFGSLANGSDGTPPTLTSGFYVFQPPIASQPVAQKAQRISVPFQIAVNLAGAVQTVNAAITLNR